MSDKERLYDEFLVASARAGERAAFNALAARWEVRLFRHAWRLIGDAEEARDIAQDAWASIASGLRRLDDSAAFSAFAFRIVTRRAADSIRRSKRLRATRAAFAADPSARAATIETPDASVTAARLNRALAGLPPDQRAAIALFYLEDMSIAEIAAALDVPAGTVKTRLMAARDKLKVALGSDEGEDR
ncbi:MAG: RNA polymerase sigma factor [Parvularculaceae bacterium]